MWITLPTRFCTVSGLGVAKSANIGKDYAVNEYNTILSKDEKHDLKQAIQAIYPNVTTVFYRHKKDQTRAWKTIKA